MMIKFRKISEESKWYAIRNIFSTAAGRAIVQDDGKQYHRLPTVEIILLESLEFC